MLAEKGEQLSVLNESSFEPGAVVGIESNHRSCWGGLYTAHNIKSTGPSSETPALDATGERWPHF